MVHGKDLVAPGYLILRGNTFGKASNGGDVIDFTGAEAPGPVMQIIDNVFEGGDDDADALPTPHDGTGRARACSHHSRASSSHTGRNSTHTTP